MVHLIKILLSGESFIPHGHCFLWNPNLVWLHFLSDLTIACAYYSIPLTLFYFVAKRPDLPFNKIFILFAAFIMACGTSHLLDVWTLWYPTYWLSGGIKAITALVSISTAIVLLQLLPQLLARPSAAQLEVANWALQQEIVERKRLETEHQRTEQALKVSQARYRAIVEDQTELIVRFAADDTILFVNGAYCRYFNLLPEAVIGNSYTPVVFADDQARVTQALSLMSAENPTVTIENRVVARGEVRWTQWVNRMLFDEQAQFLEFQSVGRDITDLKRVEARLQASLQEKEALLKEIHHRVKNNLQIVYSLLRLQRRKLKDQRAANALLESQSRIEAIALIHEKLYQSETLSQINLADYVPSLVANIFSTYNINQNQIALDIAIEPVFLGIDKAIRCGLIVNELLSNALKYAFAAPILSNLRISVLLSTTRDGESASKIKLNISDNGIGLPDQVNLVQPETLGLQLVQGFVGQLQGSLKTHRQNGTNFQITFPIDEP